MNELSTTTTPPPAPIPPAIASDGVAGEGEERPNRLRIAVKSGVARLREFLRPTYFRVHFLYICVLSLVGGAILLGLENAHTGLGYLDAFFIAVSMATGCGLTTADFTQWYWISQAVAVVVMVLGSPVLMTLVPVWFRIRLCRRKLSPLLLSRCVQYRAEIALCKIVLWYYAINHLGGFFMLFMWCRLGPAYETLFVANNKSSAQFAGLVTFTAFGQTGLTTFPDNLISFATYAFPLLIAAFLTLTGKMAFPLFMRLIVWGLACWGPAKERPVFAHLLKHPRRYFTHLYRARETWWIFILLIIVNGAQFVGLLALNWYSPVLAQLNAIDKLVNSAVLATVTRGSGFESINIAGLDTPILYLYAAAMFISSSSIWLAMYQSTLYQNDEVTMRRASSIATHWKLPPPSPPPDLQIGDASENRGEYELPPIPPPGVLPPPLPLPEPPATEPQADPEVPGEEEAAPEDTLPADPMPGASPPPNMEWLRQRGRMPSLPSLFEYELAPRRGAFETASQKDRFLPTMEGIGGVNTDVRLILTNDSASLFICVFLILVVERHLITDNPFTWSFFNIIFEVASAYGTCGLSIGFPGIYTSFSTVFATFPKLLIIYIMLLGRHRGLPINIDQAIQLSLLPEEQLLEYPIAPPTTPLDFPTRRHTLSSLPPSSPPRASSPPSRSPPSPPPSPLPPPG